MQITKYSDFALRVLIYLGLAEGRPVTISEVADRYGVSKNHLMKVVHHLARAGLVETRRGKGGGMTLGRPADEIVVGRVLRATEATSGPLVECFDARTNTCPIAESCALHGMLRQAEAAFYDTLDRFTLTDLLAAKHDLRILLKIAP